MLNSKQRAYLIGLASNLDPIAHIGKNGVSPESVQSVEEAFNTHELIKVNVQKNSPDEPAVAADKLSALVKCIEERKAGNREFLSAERQTREYLTAMELPEVDWFLLHCLPAFEKNLDELGTDGL